MVPKMEACLRAVRGGVPAAHVVDGRVAHSTLLEDLHLGRVRNDGGAVMSGLTLGSQPVAASMMDNYGTPPLALVRGEGAVVWDEAGKSYVDLLGGIAVNALGHAHPAVVAAVSRQIATLGHVSNLYVAEPPVALAELLLALVGRPGRVFFVQLRRGGERGGVQAVPAHRAHSRRGHAGRLPRPDDGRARADRAAGQGRPVPPAARRRHARPVRRRRRAGRGGDRRDRDGDPGADPGRERASWYRRPGTWPRPGRSPRAHGALLVLDEVQTGVGRTGHWFAHQADGRRAGRRSRWPRGWAAGCRSVRAWRSARRPTCSARAAHGTTFGGNPVSCAAALAVLGTIARGGLARPREAGRRAAAPRDRGARPPAGVATCAAPGCCWASCSPRRSAAPSRTAARDAGFLVNPVQPDVVRLAPPLILTAEQADAFLAALPIAVLDAGHEPRTSCATTTCPPRSRPTVLDLAARLKVDRYGHQPLAGPRPVAVIFEKPSLRTRVSFEVGIAELGGHPLIIDAQTTHFARGETDRGRAPRCCPGTSTRSSSAPSATSGSRQLAGAAAVPVVNALTDGFHPCQLLADLLTIRERLGGTAGATLAYVGDTANNMAHSYLLAGATAGMHVRVAGPAGFDPDPAVVSRAAEIAAWTGGSVDVAARPVRGGRRGRRGRHRHLDRRWVRRTTGRPDHPVPAVPGQREAARAAAAGRGRAALPAGPPRRGDHRRGAGRAAQRRARPGREPAARAEGAARHACPPRAAPTGGRDRAPRRDPDRPARPDRSR